MLTYRKKLLVILALLCAIALTACSVAPVSAAPADSSTTEQSTAEESAGSMGIHFIDADGREIHLDAPAKRIISLYSAHTENLYALGAGNLLIGSYTATIYPPEAARLEVFDFKGDPEQVIAAEPDLVLIRPYITRTAPDYLKQLEQAGITVVSLFPDAFENFEDYIQKLALLTDTEQAAQKRLAEFYGTIDAVAAATANIPQKKTVFFEATENEVRTIAPDSMVARAIASAGGINLAQDAAAVEKGSMIAPYGVEKVLEKADQIDVYIAQQGAMNARVSVNSVYDRPGYDVIRAVQQRQVHIISEKLISSPTFRYQKGVYELARYLYPKTMDNLTAYDNDQQATRLDLAEIIMKALHLPTYLPFSSSYYQTPQQGHTYGLYEDLQWNQSGFDAVETVVYHSYLDGETVDGLEYFYPDKPVTREMLANAVFALGGFTYARAITVTDVDTCENPLAVQSVIDAGVLSADNGSFNPKGTVTKAEIVTALRAILA